MQSGLEAFEKTKKDAPLTVRMRFAAREVRGESCVF
jgi:hypothetical protein